MIFEKNRIVLEIDYKHPSKWLEGYKPISFNLHHEFNEFEDWIMGNFSSPVSSCIYGGSISGCIAFSFLESIQLINMIAVVDRNKPLPYLNSLQHIHPEDIKISPDLVFISACPAHYDAISEKLKKHFQHPVIFVYMFNFKTNSNKSDDASKCVDSFIEQPRKKDQRANVLIGDSLTMNLSRQAIPGDCGVINNGSPGARLSDLLLKIDQILNTTPKSIFIMAGINDILAGTNQHDIWYIYEEIIEKITKVDIPFFIQSTLYVSPFYTSMKDPKNINEEVCFLNKKLKDFCLMNSVTFVDLNRIMSTDGYLTPTYTNDGLHLNERGYGIWGSAIKPLLV